MSTYMKNIKDVDRKWYIIDAAGKPLGKVAAKAAVILNGKHRPDYTPHVDCGDCVIVINASKIVLTGNKLSQKLYRHHTGHIGSLKEVPYSKLMETKPEFAVKLAVKGMLPKNKIASNSITRLRVFKDENHNMSAQKPEQFTR